MARNPASRGAPARSSKNAPTPRKNSVLERLAPGESRTVLHRLLAARPDLGAEVEQIARGLLRDISFESVADDVEDALRSLDLDDLGSRAGRHYGGYTSPSEAAWELLHEVAAPFLENMKRQRELGLEAGALEICKGLLLGLYRIRDLQADEFLGWAPDFPEETAADALRLWAGREGLKPTRRARRAGPHFDQKFVNNYIRDWSALVVRALKGT